MGKNKMSQNTPGVDISKPVSEMEEMAKALGKILGSDYAEEIKEKAKEGTAQGLEKGAEEGIKIAKKQKANLNKKIDIEIDDLKGKVKQKTSEAIEEGIKSAQPKTKINLSNTTVDNSELTDKVAESVEESIEQGSKKASKKKSSIKLSNKYDNFLSKVDNYKTKKNEIDLKVKTDSIEKANQEIKELIATTETEISSLSKSVQNELVDSFDKYVRTAVSKNINQLNILKKDYRKIFTEDDLLTVTNWQADLRQVPTRANIIAREKADQKYNPNEFRVFNESLQKSLQKELIPALKASVTKRFLNQLSESARNFVVGELDKGTPPSKILSQISSNNSNKYIKKDFTDDLIVGTTELSSARLADMKQLVELVGKLDSYYKSIGQEMPDKYHKIANTLLNNTLLFNESDTLAYSGQAGKNDALSQIAQVKNKATQDSSKNAYKELNALRNGVSRFINNELTKLKAALSEDLDANSILQINDALQKMMSMSTDLSLDKFKDELLDLQDSIIDIADAKNVDLDQVFDATKIAKQTKEIKTNTKIKKENNNEKISIDTSEIEKETAAYAEETVEIEKNAIEKKKNQNTKTATVDTKPISEVISEQNKLQAELDETDQKAKELAKSFTTAYHNSDNVFDMFDSMMRGQHGDLVGKASYFSTSKTDSFAKADFGKYQTEWTLDLQKTFDIIEGFTEEQINRIMKQFFADLPNELQDEIRNAFKSIKLNAKPSINTIQKKGGVDFGNILSFLGYDSSFNSLLGELAVYDDSKVKRANDRVWDNTTQKYLEFQNKTQEKTFEISTEIVQESEKAVQAISEVEAEAVNMADIVERAFRLDTHTTPNDNFVKTVLNASVSSSTIPLDQTTKVSKKNIIISGQEMYEDMVISANRAKQAEQNLEDENEELISSMKQLKQTSNGQYFEDLEILEENTIPRLYAEAIHNVCDELETTQAQARLTAAEIRNMQNSFTSLNGLDIMGDIHQAKIDLFENGGWIRNEGGTFEGHNAYTKALNKVMNQKTSYKWVTNPETKEKELERFDTYDVNYDKLLKEIIKDDTAILELERKISQASEAEAAPLRENLSIKKQEVAVYDELMKFMATQPEYMANRSQLETVTAIRALNEEEIRNKYLAEDAAKAEKKKANAIKEAAAVQQKQHDDWVKSQITTASSDNKTATKAYDDLYKKASRYYELLKLDENGKITGEQREELSKLRIAWDDATKGIHEYTIWQNGTAESLEKVNAAREKFLNDSGNEYKMAKSEGFNKTILKLDSMIDTGKFTDDYRVKLRDLRKEIDEFNQKPIQIDTKEARESLQKLEDKISETLGEKGLSSNKQAAQTSLNKLAHSIEDIMAKNSAMGKDFKDKFENLRINIDAAKSNADVEALKANIIELETEMIKAGKTGKSFMDTLKERIVGVNAQFIAQYFSIQDWIRYIRQASQEVIALDTAITELRKVSDASNERLAQSFEKSAKTAQELGQTIEHVINVTADWSRLGFSVDDAEELARVTALFTTVGDNMTADDASSYLISTLQGFHIAANDAEAVIDKYNEVEFASIYSNVNASVCTG